MTRPKGMKFRPTKVVSTYFHIITFWQNNGDEILKQIMYKNIISIVFIAASLNFNIMTNNV